MKNTMIQLLPLLALLLAGCEKKSVEAPAGASSGGADPALEALFLAAAPGDAQAIHLARGSAKPGDELVLSGRVMGADEPFVAGRAAFVLGDPTKLTACSDRPGDECPTPWDNCCDTPEAKREGTATIQVLGPDGRVLKAGLEGVHGLAKLSRVVVKGKVADGSGPDALVVNATGIHVVP